VEKRRRRRDEKERKETEQKQCISTSSSSAFSFLATFLALHCTFGGFLVALVLAVVETRMMHTRIT
jgi:hypothetical protein